MELDPIDFYPAYDICRTRSTRRSSCCPTFCTHLLAILTSVSICAAGFYYYEMHYELHGRVQDEKLSANPSNGYKNLAALQKEIATLKEETQKMNEWRSHLTDLFSTVYMRQQNAIEKTIEEALEIYDADKVGLFDFASVYAGGSIIATPFTEPYPANKTMSFFNLVSMDLKSNPESLIQPENFPGNCFAFHGSQGRIRIKLGNKRIRIRAVTMEHLKYTDDSSSAPKDFEVYGLHDADDEVSMLLGRFRYNIKGKTYQTFQIENNLPHVSFGYVELHILNNYGKHEYTCVYRFRVHNRVEPYKRITQAVDNKVYEYIDNP